jgi:hypothetical protein
MSDSHQRINKNPAGGRPQLDFVSPQAGSRLRTPLAVMALLSAAVFVFQGYLPWLQKKAGAVAHEWRIDTPLAENANHAVAAVPEVVTMEESNQDQLAMRSKADEVKTEIKRLPRQSQSQRQSATRRSPRVIPSTASKSMNRAKAVRAALAESKAVDVDTGSVALPEMLAQRKEPQQQIVIPEVIFNRHGRLMESKNE